MTNITVNMVGGDTRSGPHDDATIEIDVGVELAVDEIGILEGLLFEAAGDVEERVLDVEFLEDGFADALKHFGAGVVILVNAVAEAHRGVRRFPSAWRVRCALCAACSEATLMDLIEHFEDFNIRPAMERTPEGTHAGRDAGKHVGFAGADHADGAGGAILLVIGMEDENEVQGVLDFRIGLVIVVGHREHHVKQVAAIAPLWMRINIRQALHAAVDEAGDSADFADQTGGSLLE